MKPLIVKTEKRCSSCKEIKPIEAFGIRVNHGRYVYEPRCKPCLVVQQTAYVRKYPERYRAKCKRTNVRYKATVIGHYGGVCACCGEQDIRFLTIDHKEGNGAHHRKVGKCGSGTTFYAWLIRFNFPDGYQVLCYNCNLAKSNNGKCPHAEFDPMTMIGACA